MWINVKEGVIFKKITPEMIDVFDVMLRVWKALGLTPTITSANDDKHSKNSLHYKDRALDIRIFDIPKTKHVPLVNTLKAELGGAYDVVLENDHIHLEYDPKV